jgi:hypothetical protein
MCDIFDTVKENPSYRLLLTWDICRPSQEMLCIHRNVRKNKLLRKERIKTMIWICMRIQLMEVTENGAGSSMATKLILSELKLRVLVQDK